VGIAKDAGLPIGTNATPDYQDIAFKLDFANGKAGKFTLFGIGGLSDIAFLHDEIDETDLFAAPNEDAYAKSRFGILGLRHNLILDETAYLSTVVAASTSQNKFDSDEYFDQGTDSERLLRVTMVDNKEYRLSLSSFLNKKFSARFTGRAGILAEGDEVELVAALEKFEGLFGKTEKPTLEMDAIQALLKSMAQPEYSSRFVIKSSQGLTYISVPEIAWFLSEGGLTYLVSKGNKKHHLDYTLEQLEDLLDPKSFFRINRKMIVGIESVQKVSDYFNSRLKITLQPASGNEDSIVSRERVKAFRGWLGA